MRHVVRALSTILLVAVTVGCASAPAPARPAGAAAAPAVPGPSHVILVSFDGLRADYLDRYALPAFERAMREGTRASALVPVFPTKTFPNHYTIVTGLYTEHHGIVANVFWDPARRESYALGDQNAVTDGTWYRGEPIWATAVKQGVKAASFFWPGSEAAIGGVRPTYWKTYDGRIPNADRVDAVLEWLRLPPDTRPRLVTLYFSDVDGAAHRSGPWAPEVRDALSRVDASLGRLLDGIETLSIRDQVYVVLVSDHGMAESSRDRTVALETLIDMKDIIALDAGPTASLHVSGGPERARQVRDDLNARLRHGRAYLREDVPERLHYRADPRIGDLVVVMEEHYMMSARERDGERFPAGMHGWDPALPSMHGIFLVTGPGIRKGARVDAVENIDIYPFLAELLEIEPAGEIDGRRGRIRNAVSEPAVATRPTRRPRIPAILMRR